MKTTHYLKTAIIAITVLFSSCTNDEDPGSNDSGSGPFVAKVDNQSFPKADIKLSKAKYVSSTKMLQIIGQPADQKETIVLTLISFGGKVAAVTDWKAGTYDFNPAQMNTANYMASAGYSKWNGNSYDAWNMEWEYVQTGSIIIESNDGSKIKGTFSFDAVKKNNNGSYDTGSIKKITEGAFDLSISNY